MKKSFLFKLIFVICVGLVCLSWVGQVFDDDDGFLEPFYLPAPIHFAAYALENTGSYFFKEASRPILSEPVSAYLEMREKSPPLRPFSF